MPEVFDCEECGRRCYDEYGYYTGSDHDGWEVVDFYICEACAEDAKWSEAFHEDEAARVKELHEGGE